MAKFETTIGRSGKTATGILIPDEVIEQFGAGKKPPVKVTLNGYTYQSTVAVMGGRYMVGVSADVRKAAHVEGADTLTVEIELDKSERKMELPADFKGALGNNKKAETFFASLTFSQQKNYIYQIEQARTNGTRQKRIIKAIENLLAGKK